MSRLPKLSELKECPKCGYDEFYVYQKLSGTVAYREKFNGEIGDNTEMMDGVSFVKTLAFVYCGNCQEKIARNDKI